MYLLLFAAPDDFLELSGTLELTSTATRRCISIHIVDDSVKEADQECFTVSLSKSSGNANFTLSPAVTTACINDMDGELINISILCTHL